MKKNKNINSMVNNNKPKKTRRKKKYRIILSKEWIRNYIGENIVKDYAKWFGVDLICGINELRSNGVIISNENENSAKQSIEENKRLRKLNKENRIKREQEEESGFSDYRLAFIAGHTTGGVPFGITHGQMKEFQEIDSGEEINFNKKIKF
jgi:hypothetical protein